MKQGLNGALSLLLTFPGSHFSKAIFVPNLSTYSKVTSGASVIPVDIPARDLSWQLHLQRMWEKIVNGRGNFLNLVVSNKTMYLFI